MKSSIAKYFWGFNERALIEAQKALVDPDHPRFPAYSVTLLSRCQKPKELFSLFSKKHFIENWPKIKSYWLKLERRSELRSWWEAIYAQIKGESGNHQETEKTDPSALFKDIGRLIRGARVQKNMSQNDLAARSGMKQPDISKIEEGRKNITLGTLAVLCKVLGIKEIKLD
ncbi:MAG: helix-turn-helix transcriptional regulator [Candidatus Omnitrophota bacterium]|nr:helix-turn-helix transcriptional regulator [Candidatus Omnitrophota bacterium]